MSDDENRSLRRRPVFGISSPDDQVRWKDFRGQSIELPANDAATYTQMGEVAGELSELSMSMNKLKAIDGETRRLIRACRLLAIDLQGEIERRIQS